MNIPVESLIYQNQKAYYDALQASTDHADSAPFIEFILQMILDAIVASSASDQDTAQVSTQDTVQASDQVKRLIEKMDQKEYSLSELMSLLDLSHRATFPKII